MKLIHDYWQVLLPALISAGGALLMGKTIRRLLLLPFELISRKTASKLDDQLVKDAEQDLGLDALPEDEKK
jgi:hypothetical protein